MIIQRSEQKSNELDFSNKAELPPSSTEGRRR